MDPDWGRVLAAVVGLLLAIPAVCLRLVIRFVALGCGIFQVKKRPFPPACLVDPSLGNHSYATVNGVKIHYVEAGEADKPMMVMVHGFPQFWYSWRHQIRHFKATHRVIALDMRGYNESEKPEGINAYFIKNMVDDIKCLVESFGAKKFTLVAHDWGGVVAWTFAGLYPEMLNKLVALNIPHPMALMEQRKKGWEQALKSWYIAMFQCPLLPELGCMAEDMAIFKRLFHGDLAKDEEMIEAYKFAFRDYTTWNRAINYYRSLTSKQHNTFMQTNKDKFYISVKTLQIFGTEDLALTVAAAKDSAPYLKEGRLELLEGVSHWVQEEAPQRVNSLIEQFLAETE